MKNLIPIIAAALGLSSCASASPAKRAGSKSWAGTSNYFLQGMSQDAQKTYLSALADGGIKVIRLWVNNQPGGNACVKGGVSVTGVDALEPKGGGFGNWNKATLDLLDQTLVFAGQNGLKVIISPHDQNQLGTGNNGPDIYGEAFGPGYFYEWENATNAYDNRLKYILNYKGATSGKVWKNWNDVIMAFDLGNEPFNAEPAKCQYDSAGPWVCGRAQTLRSTLGADNPIKVATGALGGDIINGCTFISGAVNCGQVDIMSVHRYAGGEGDNPNQWSGSYSQWLDQANGKLVHLEEWGVGRDKFDQASEFPANTEDMNSAGLPWTYWQILPHQECDASGDQDYYGFPIDGDVDWQSQAKAASQADCPQDWTGIVY